jgi:hypothetical protein
MLNLNKFLDKIMCSSLTKNYELDKETYMHGGLHNLWKVYRAKKKDRGNMDCSVFIFEKKTLEKKINHLLYQVTKKHLQELELKLLTELLKQLITFI